MNLRLDKNIKINQIIGVNEDKTTQMKNNLEIKNLFSKIRYISSWVEMLEVKIIKCLSDNYSYLIIDEETKTVGVVDPSEFDPVEKKSKNFNKLDFL